MDIKDMKYFLAVAEEGTVTKAAEKLCISQPPLSRQLKDLENELGVVLFNRGKRHIELTKDGEFFKQQVEEILSLVQVTESHLKNKTDNTNGIVNIGVTEACGAGVFSEIVMDFHKKYPNIQYNIWCSNSEDIGERVSKGLVDIGIIREPFNSINFDSISLRKEMWIVMISKEHPLAKISGKTIELSQIANYPLIVPSRQPMLDEINSWFKAEGTNRNILCRYNTISCIIPIIEKSMGVAITTESACLFTDHTKFVYKTIVNPQRFSNLIMLKRRTKIIPPTANIFWDFVQKNIENFA